MIWSAMTMMMLGLIGYVVFIILLRDSNSRTYSVLGFISALSLAFGWVLLLRLAGIT